MMQAIRSVARTAQRTTVAVRAAATVTPLRTFTVPAFRMTSPAHPGDASLGIPAGLNLRTEQDGTQWADYRPENLRNIQAVRNDDGDLVGQFEGETVIFPDLEPTLEWVLSTPVDLHLFEEAPIIKVYIEESNDARQL